jgi:putative ABC transport system permease protein
MIAYDLRLAWLNVRRNPVLSALTIIAMALGIGTCTEMVTIYQDLSGDPIWWKSDQLYAVTLDLKTTDWKDDQSPMWYWEEPPRQLAYRDAVALFRSTIPERKAMMYRAEQVLGPGIAGMKPFDTLVRLTTADFFAMFDVPFRYGGGWTAAADAGPEPVAVLSKRTNDRVFGGANSVGKSIDLNGRAYRIMGVLDVWVPRPKFYDLNNGAFQNPEDIYLPFRWGETLELMTAGSMNCLAVRYITFKTFRELLSSNCTWIQFWAELPDHERLQRFQQFIDSYVLEQKKLGRFPRPLNNRIEDVRQWLKTNDVVGADNRIIFILGFMFFAVCLLNSIGLILAKVLASSPLVGIRRALGASRSDILRQHLIDGMAIGVAGGMLGLLLAAIVLELQTHHLLLANPGDNPETVTIVRSLFHIDESVVAITFGLSLLAGLIASLYPAWRISRVAPAIYLKSQ